MHRDSIRLVPYNPMWPDMYESESHVLKGILQDNLLEIHHIGSTAIPGIYAKPIIDIMPIVRNLSAVDDANPRFVEQGYTPKGENGIPGRRYFRKGDPFRTHHVHVYEPDAHEVEMHLLFREYMRAHPAEAEAYSILKQDLARRFTDDRAAYTDSKDEFIQERIRRALLWKQTE